MDFIFLGSKITVDGDCSYEIKRCLLLGRKAMTNLDSVLKSRDTTLMPKFHIVEALIFPVVMYRCDSWTIKGRVPKNWFLWTVVLEKMLMSLGLQGDQTKSILKEISLEYSLEGLMLKLKLQSFGQLKGRADSFEKTDTWKDWRQEEKGMTEDEMVGCHHWLSRHESEQILGESEGQGSLACCSPWGPKDLGLTEWLNSNKTWKSELLLNALAEEWLFC